VSMMAGKIGVESQVGVGSSFHFTARFDLPSAPAPEKALADPACLRGLRTLVVDDNETNRHILGAMLGAWRMDVELVDSGELVEGMLQNAQHGNAPFRLVVLDAMMPVVDGFEVARRVKQNFGEAAPIVMMLSSGGLNSSAEQCRRLGITRYVMKPVSRNDLLDAVLRSLGHERPKPVMFSHDGYAESGNRTLSILVAEDNRVNQRVVEGILRKAGHSVSLAADGLEALEAWRRRHFDLILMDVQMPRMDGFEATRQVREHEKHTGTHIPIVALTAHALKGDRERCIEAGMDEYVTKPVSRTSLGEAIQAVTGANALKVRAPSEYALLE
jgi:two-component system, sensor histidine kinase and response regulator